MKRAYCKYEFINDFYDNADNVFNEVKDKLSDMLADSFVKVLKVLSDLNETAEVDTTNSEDHSRKA